MAKLTARNEELVACHTDCQPKYDELSTQYQKLETIHRDCISFRWQMRRVAQMLSLAQELYRRMDPTLGLQFVLGPNPRNTPGAEAEAKSKSKHSPSAASPSSRSPPEPSTRIMVASIKRQSPAEAAGTIVGLLFWPSIC